LNDPAAKVGSFIEFSFSNIGAIGENITLNPGSSVSFYGGGSLTLFPGGTYNLIAIATNVVSPAVTIYNKALFGRKLIADGYASVGNGGDEAQVLIGKGIAIQSGPVLGLVSRFRQQVATTLAISGTVTYTSAAVIGGYILRDTVVGAVLDVTPTAAQMVAALAAVTNGDVEVNSFVRFTINNVGANTFTFNGGAGITNYGGVAFSVTNATRSSFVLIVDNIGSGTEACTIYPEK
jgi:hypothetical protein